MKLVTAKNLFFACACGLSACALARAETPALAPAKAPISATAKASTLLKASTAAPADRGAQLTLAEAREEALKTHPRITIAELRLLVANEGKTEARAGYLPFLSADATAVGTADPIMRVATGGLSNPAIYDHTGVALTVTQLITDFGRTTNLIGAAREQSLAAQADLMATREQLSLAVDGAYFEALQSRAVESVARQTLDERQAVYDQVNALAKNQLKSDLDVRFAKVGVDEARLLVDQAESDWQSALATLADLVGWGDPSKLGASLVEEPFLKDDAPSDIDAMIEHALNTRPELASLRAQREAALSLARAARDGRAPVVSLFGTAGLVPDQGAGDRFNHDYAAGGINIDLPIFTGGLYKARQTEAELQAREAESELADRKNDIVRDVRLAWIAADHAHERVTLTASLLESANDALILSKARFDQGLGSIVELNQAQLAQTSAAIEMSNAQYEYRIKHDVLDYQLGDVGE